MNRLNRHSCLVVRYPKGWRLLYGVVYTGIVFLPALLAALAAAIYLDGQSFWKDLATFSSLQGFGWVWIALLALGVRHFRQHLQIVANDEQIAAVALGLTWTAIDWKEMVKIKKRVTLEEAGIVETIVFKGKTGTIFAKGYMENYEPFKSYCNTKIDEFGVDVELIEDSDLVGKGDRSPPGKL